ncbi:imidazole glycerol phosphate synthase subunit HisH [Alphaproteobacteria bacterium]|nr:imidazole glycerol phosphate synthase subunit HisH [Alphaproteobacteria bacterium]
MKKNITIIDYGSGNILSAKQSFAKVIKMNDYDADVNISGKPEVVKKSTHVVLPGQGAFETCITGLKKIPGMVEELSNFAIKEKKPFFGICVGMQLLADNSEENGNHKGFGWIDGTIKKLPSKQLKMPHMGWNSIKLSKNKKHKITPKETDYYFVHSYYFDCKNKENILAETSYGINFPSIINKENIYGFQFHPEKSSNQGLDIIKSFLTL